MCRTVFGTRLKELRATKTKQLGRRRIPQREVAQALNISAGAYGSWESGRTRPDVTLLPKIAEYFAVALITYVAILPAFGPIQRSRDQTLA